jgi:hypothetical protein
MTKKNDANAPRGSAWPEKPVEQFYVAHPKVGRALLGPLLKLANAGQNNGVVPRLFASAARGVPND